MKKKKIPVQPRLPREAQDALRHKGGAHGSPKGKRGYSRKLKHNINHGDIRTEYPLHNISRPFAEYYGEYKLKDMACRKALMPNKKTALIINFIVYAGSALGIKILDNQRAAHGELATAAISRQTSRGTLNRKRQRNR